MNQLQLPPEFDLPAGRMAARRDVLVDETERVVPDRSMWRRPAALVAVAAAAVIAVVAVPLNRDGTDGQVLAYALAAGDHLTYEFAYDSSTSQIAIGGLHEGLTLGGAITVTAHGQIAYTIEQGPDAATLVVQAVANGGQVVAEDGVPFEDETADPASWPPVEVIVDARGRIVDWLGDGSVEIPGFLVQSPSPGQAERTILPYSFGPTFPDDALGVGDTWTTEQAPFDCETGMPAPSDPTCDAGLFVVGDHRVVREEAMNGRSTLVVESTYTEPPRPDVEVLSASNEATVWFDPTDGIIVKVQWTSSMESDRNSTFNADPPLSWESRDVRDETFTAELIDD